MNRFYGKSILFAAILLASGLFQKASAQTLSELFNLNVQQEITRYATAPKETVAAVNGKKGLIVSLPTPEGATADFYAYQSSIFSAAEQAKYPDIHSYQLQSVDNKAVTGRITLSPYGLFATVLGEKGLYTIQPTTVNVKFPTLHLATYGDPAAPGGVDCNQNESAPPAPGGDPKEKKNAPGQAESLTPNGATRKTYKTVVISTGEFFVVNGASSATIITNSINALQAIMDKEFAVRFLLNGTTIYMDPATDPFTPVNSGPDNRTTQAAQAIAAVYTSSQYDVGHVYHNHTAGGWYTGGVAQLNAVCSNNALGTGLIKGGGWSGSFSNVGNGWVRLMTHEYGHMFAQTHTFNGTGSSCTSNISSTSAYEIGSGTTIMSYNGLCQADNNIPGGGVEDNYFHTHGTTQTVNFITNAATGGSCPTTVSTGNTPPVANANPCGGTQTIPIGTPFTLTGSATDANGDAMTYCWEEYDEDGAGTPTQGFIGAVAAASTIAPLFRSFAPTTSLSRTFPTESLVIANSYASSFEPLPTVARTLNFRLTVRDNNANGGGIHSSPLAVTVSALGPLSVTAPNGGETWAAGSTQTVTWAVNSTNTLSANVNIKLSVDGGNSYPYTLATATANDGSESVTLPTNIPNTTQARMRVESTNNTCVVFFDITNTNFTITSTCLAAPSGICPTAAVTLPAGDAGLNFSFKNYNPVSTTSKAFTVIAADPDMTRCRWNNAITACMTPGAPTTDYQEFHFVVSVTGTYSFSFGASTFRAVHLFSAPFSTSAPCGTFVASSVQDGGGFYTGIITTGTSGSIQLTACTEYVMVVTTEGFGGNTTVTFAGAGNVNEIYASPTNYAYTYIAVNNANGQVALVNATGNFTALAGGSYCIYGVSYKTGGATPPPNSVPANWVGQTIAAIQAGGECIQLSGNCKQVTVTTTCTAPVVTAPTVTQPSCPTPATGTIVVNATGGTFEYSVNGGSTWQLSNTFTGLAAGNYNIQVRFQSNPSCLTIYSGNPVVINAAPAAPVVNAPTVTQPGCPTPASGTIVVNATGGATLEYSTNGGSSYQASATFSGLAAGNYNIRVRYVATPACFTDYLSNPVVINAAPAAPVVNAPTVTQPGCPTPASGTIVVNATGGATLEYSTNGGSSYQASATFSGLAAGNYNIRVRYVATPACFTDYGSNPVVINAAPAAPVVNAPTITQPGCPTPASGTIVVNATGGATLEYSTNGGSSYQASATFSGLAAGNYNIRVRYVATPACFTDYLSNPVVINAAPAAPVVNAPTVTQPGCPTPANGTIVVNATGGATLEYSTNGGSSYQASATFSGLAAGNYNIRVRYVATPACFTDYLSNPVVINAAPAAPVVNAPTVTQPGCPTPANGTIVVNATGGATLEYSTNGGSSYQASATFSGLAAGNYNIRVRYVATPACFTDYGSNPVVINAAPAAPVVNAPTVTQPGCPTPATGTIVVNATGGATLEYSTNGGSSYQASATFSGLAAGNYNIRVRYVATPACFTDYVSNPVVINAAPAAPVVNAPTVTQPGCPTPANGTIVVNATGGATLEYSTNGGSSYQASATFSGLAAGNYNIRVRYVATPACFTDYLSNPVVINAAPAAPVVNAPTVTQPGCPTPANGTIVVNATGGATLEYSTNGGSSYQASATFSGLAAGNYNIRVRYVATPACFTDYLSNPVVINAAPAAPVVNAPTVTQPGCPTPANGTIVVNATGGATLEYSTNGGSSYQASATFSGLAAGNYNIRVRYVATPACFTDYGSNPVVINAAPAAPVVNAPTVTQPGCPTPATGTIVVNATGGATLEYSTNGGSSYQASATFSGLAAGNYNIRVRYVATPACFTDYGSNPVVINAAPAAPVVNAPTVTQPGCPTPASGTIVVNATGGATLEYSTNGGSSYQASATFSGLAAGNYNIRVRYVATPACFTDYLSNPVVINAAPAAPVVNAPTVTQPGCPTPATGTIVVNATGGATLEYSTNGGSSYQASATFSGLAAGNYNIRVRYVATPACFTDYGSNPVVINAAPAAPVVNAPTVTQPGCPTPASGTIVVNATGGATLEYSTNGGSSYQASATFSGLAAGNYSIRVRYVGNPSCFTDYSANPVVINAAPPTPVVTAPTVTQPSCPTPATGTIVVNATGGILEYSINGGSTWQTANTFSGLAAGNYFIQARFAANPTCLTAYSGNPVVINNPVGAPVVSAPTVTQPGCPTPVSGTIVVNATGGGTLEYSANGGATWQLSATFTGLAAGNYNIQVRLQATPACVSSYSGNPVVIIAAPNPPIVDGPAVTQPACPSPATGTIVVNASGGGTLEYSINGGATWQLSATFPGLAPGNYNIQVRLQASPSCVTSYVNNPVVIVAPPAPPVVNAPTVTQPACPAPAAGTIVVNATGGATLEFSINGGTSYQASATFTGLAAGNYNIRVRYVATPACFTNYSANPVVINSQPAAPVVNAPTVTQPACPTPATGTIVVNATGGTFEYSVNGGSTWQASSTFSGLASGNYNVQVRFQSNPTCLTSYSGNPVVINSQPAAPVVSAPTITQPACPTPAAGTIVVNATGGIFEYSINGGSTWQASATFTGLAAGNYNIQVRFQANPACLTSYSGNPVVINSQPAAPVVNAPTVTQPSCPSPATGTIVVNATGGTLEYSINGGSSWQSSATFSGLSAGNYNVQVRFQANPACLTSYSGNPVVINNPVGAPTITAPTVAQPGCPTPSTGTIVVNATGGGTLEYSINGGSTWQLSATFPGLAVGNYNIQVRLQATPACLSIYSSNPVAIIAAPAPVVNAPTVTQPACPTPATGTIVVNATGGTFEYSINGGSTWQASNSFSGLSAGNYNIQVRFQANPTCLTIYSGNPVVINSQPAAPVVNAPTVTQPGCPTPASGTIVVNATGGGTLEYSINGGAMWQASATFTGLAAGNYNIQVRLQATPACISSYSGNPVVINNPVGSPTITAPTVTQPGCPTPASGTIVVNATGGGTLEYSINGGSSWQASATFTGLAAGNYNIQVRLQATPACVSSYSGNPVVINNPVGAPVISAPTVTQPACPTPSTGTILVNATGGGTLEYSINGGSSWQSGATFSGLAAGNYNIQVRLQATPACISIYSGNPVVLNAAPTAPVVNAPTVTQPGCPTPVSGSILVNATGGATLEFSINGGTSYQPTANFTGLAAGNYSIRVRYVGNPACFTDYSANPVVINAAPSAPVVTAPTVTQPACPSPATGTIVVNATGGATLEFSINGGTSYQASSTFSGLAAGNYSIRVRYVGNPACFTDYSANPVVINNPVGAPVISVPTVTQPACPTPSTGTILVNATGGGALEYSINGGSSWQSGATFSGLAAGNFNIQVRLQASPACISVYSGNPVVINAAPTAPVVNAPTVTQPGCPTPVSGSILVNATGGATLEFSINGGTSYQPTANFTGLAAGNYSIRVRYVGNPACFTDYSANPLVINAAPSAPVVTAPTVTQPACPSPATGTIVVNATGGATLEFSINGGTSYQASSTFSGLAAGNYSIRVRYVGNPACFTDYSANPVVINSAPLAPVVNAPTVTQPACPVPVAGSILVNATGGLTLEYSINGGATWQLSNSFTGLAAGNYVVQVRYQSSPTCVVNYSGNPVVINAQPSAPVVSAPTVTQPACPSPSTGTILVNATGGGALEFSINGGASYQTSATFSGLAAGNYTVRVRFIGTPACFTDYSANPVIINAAPNPPAIALPTLTQPACPVPLTGTILVNATGSLAMEFSINGGATWQASNSFPGLAPGSFNIAVRYQSAPLCITNYAGNPVSINNTTPPTVFSMTGGGQYCAPGLGLPVGLSGSQLGFNYQLQRNAVNVGTPVAGTGTPISFGNQTIAGNYSVVATNPATGCAVTTTVNVTVGTFTCAPVITDPCVCKNNATNLSNGQFEETIQVNAPNGQTWTVTAVTGLYSLTSNAPPAAPTAVTVGTALTALGGNAYQLKGIHIDALGYTLTVSNGTTSLNIGNSCAYPNPDLNTIADDNLCKNSPVITLTGNPGDGNILGQSFTVDGQPATVFNPATAAPGPHTVVYTVNGGTPKAFGPDDPGCIQSVSKTLTIVTSSPIVVCNDDVQVSLDEDCAVPIVPDMVLEGTYACFDDYKVVLTLPNGTVIPNATVTSAHIGKVVKATITHIPSGNSCWGFLHVEDKLAPKITCSNITVPCVVTNFSPSYLAGTLGFAAAQPVVTENCGTVSVVYFDGPLVDLPCGNSPDHSARFTRKWTATDAYGNFSTCEQTIFLLRKHGPDVKFPADVTIDCTNANTDPTATGAPYLVVNGLNFSIFNTNNACEINSAFTDILLPVCSGSFKILRTWTVYDWCLPTAQPGTPNPNPIFFTQVIMVKDQAGPQILDCPVDFTVSIDPYGCSKNLDLPTLTVHDNCSDLESGWATFTNPVTLISQTINATITADPNWTGNFLVNYGTIAGMPIGVHPVKLYIKDDCGNESNCTVNISIEDLQPPVPLCQEFTQIAIGAGLVDNFTCPGESGPNGPQADNPGTAIVPAESFNSGSYDFCGPVWLKVRRMQGGSCGSTSFNDAVTFCCSDINKEWMVVLRVYDVDPGAGSVSEDAFPGHWNDCMITAFVEDKVKPLCQAPANKTVNCDEFDPLTWYGDLVFSDNCGIKNIDTAITYVPNQIAFEQCNYGQVRRAFTVFDCSNNSSRCTQTITVNYKEQYRVYFPDDQNVTQCNGTVMNTQPTIFGENCELIGITHADELFDIVPDACYKILRTWRVINWCTYNPNLPDVIIPNANTSTQGARIWIGSTVQVPPAAVPGIPGYANYNPNSPDVPTIFPMMWNYPAPLTGTANNPLGTPAFTYTQIIKVQDATPPQANIDPVLGAANYTFCDYSTNDPLQWNQDATYNPYGIAGTWSPLCQSHDLCEGAVDLSIFGTDDCTDDNVNFRYLLFLDLNGDGVMETTVNSEIPTLGFGIKEDELVTVGGVKYRIGRVTRDFETDDPDHTKYAQFALPYGKHKIKWVLEDRCGNDFTKEFPIEVKDCKNPTVVCINGLSINSMNAPVGTTPAGVTLWAIDFLQYAEDNCTDASQLVFAIRDADINPGTGFPLDANGQPQSSLTWDCSQLGTNVVELWARDKAGNADFCLTYLILTDNTGNCQQDPIMSIAGDIKTKPQVDQNSSLGVAEVSVAIEETTANPAFPGPSYYPTPDNGHFDFTGLPMANDWLLTPKKDLNPLNGVSTFDLVRMSKHILNVQPFTTGYQFVAADINHNNQVTTFDIVELRKLILGIYSDFPANESWRFIDKNHVFDMAAPLNATLPETKLGTFDFNNHFIGVKIGDLTGDAIANNLMVADDRTFGTLLVNLNERQVGLAMSFW